MRAGYEQLDVSLGGTLVVRELSLELPEGQVTALVGPNGSGKSTALRCAYRALRPDAGAVWVGQRRLADLTLRESAQLVGAVSQDAAGELDFSVRELVALGRAPHLRGNEPLSPREWELCDEAMTRMDILDLADRGILELSGGERQRALIARALAQEPRVLVLDEPTNHLDIRHQIELLALLRRIELTVLVVLHDLNLAASSCDRLAVMHEGRLVACGPPGEVLDAELVRAVFGVQASVVEHPLTGAPQLIYDLESQRSSLA